jgi:hypothetical protein
LLSLALETNTTTVVPFARVPGGEELWAQMVTEKREESNAVAMDIMRANALSVDTVEEEMQQGNDGEEAMMMDVSYENTF